MSKLLINTSGLKNHFNPVINDSIEDLVNAINLAESLDIPSGFSYHTYLKTLPEAIRKNKNNCVVVKEFVTNSIVSLNNTSLEVCDLFNKIGTIVIKDRTSIIK